MEDRNNEEMEINLLELAKVLWKKVWIIILCTVLCGAAGFVGSKLMITPMYRAEALFYVNNSSFSIGTSSFSISTGEISAAKCLVNTYVIILKSRTMLEDVIAEANLDYTYDELKNMISADSVNSTEIFSISVENASPEMAEKITNTIARLLPDKIATIVDGASVRVVDYAVVPVEKSSPSNSKNAMIGAALGFVLSCAVIVVMYLLDDTIHSEEYLTQTYEYPVLAGIPDLHAKTSKAGYYYKNPKN